MMEHFIAGLIIGCLFSLMIASIFVRVGIRKPWNALQDQHKQHMEEYHRQKAEADVQRQKNKTQFEQQMVTAKAMQQQREDQYQHHKTDYEVRQQASMEEYRRQLAEADARRQEG